MGREGDAAQDAHRRSGCHHQEAGVPPRPAHRGALRPGQRAALAASRAPGLIVSTPITGKLRWLGLGSAKLVPLAEARKLAQEYRRMVRIERRDPIEERRAAKAEALKARRQR